LARALPLLVQFCVCRAAAGHTSCSSSTSTEVSAYIRLTRCCCNHHLRCCDWASRYTSAMQAAAVQAGW
jgi:hypothetical protein